MLRPRVDARTLAMLLVGAGCSCAPPSPTGPPPRSTAQAPAPAPTAPTAPQTSAPASRPTCGKIACLLFDTPQQAFASVLQAEPLIVAVGETHAQKGTEQIPSTTQRFTEQLLPVLKERASDLVLELWVADGSCGASEQRVARKQTPVTETQAEGNRNEFLALGNKSQSLGIRPHVLRPSCEEYTSIVAAGEDAVAEMLAMIARLTAAMVKAILKRNEEQGTSEVVVAYGGIMHNDLRPRPGREQWSFGPALHAHAAGSYAEVDLIVPEYIKDGPPWTSLDWVSGFDKNEHPDKARLLNPGAGSYVLVFPSSHEQAD